MPAGGGPRGLVGRGHPARAGSPVPAALLPLLIVAGTLGAVVGFFARLAARIRRRGLAGGAVRAGLASYEEAFRVTSHESFHEIPGPGGAQGPFPADDPWLPARRRAPAAEPGAPRPERRRRRTLRRPVRWWWRRR
ncbi:hypothetical protein RB196_03050 [Streptomyces sp. PmtA]|uniref:hypothetical protein n=1 Tax=Streptomyces sp. PmtA TaxID=3074275 RepID=UPI003014267C